jgi:microcystin-dependent protein
MTRAVAITIAAKTGEETHIITVPELAAHGHSINDPQHAHSIYDAGHAHGILTSNGGPANQGGVYGSQYPNGGPFGVPAVQGGTGVQIAGTGISIYGAATGITVTPNGGGGGHETVQPTVMVPYIVKLDD